MMRTRNAMQQKEVLFRRHCLEVGSGIRPGRRHRRDREDAREVSQPALKPLSNHEHMVTDISEEKYRVLVINSSQDMAKEMTFQLSVEIPGCSLMYAPTLQLASCILKKREVDLIVSDPILPDGNVTSLNETLLSMETPPDLMVVGGLSMKGASELNASGYRFGGVRHKALKRSNTTLVSAIEKSSVPEDDSMRLAQAIKGLGADIRNDLNNPLQEIVAMLFVARANTEPSPGADLALTAIEKAAQNMAGIVRGLEDKIRSTVIES